MEGPNRPVDDQGPEWAVEAFKPFGSSHRHREDEWVDVQPSFISRLVARLKKRRRAR